MEHYQCYALVKSNTEQKVLSNTVEFLHVYLTISAVTLEDKIINGLQLMARALKNTPHPTSVTQLEAIEKFQSLFGLWQLLSPKTLSN
jgi:hypothetical protein